MTSAATGYVFSWLFFSLFSTLTTVIVIVFLPVSTSFTVPRTRGPCSFFSFCALSSAAVAASTGRRQVVTPRPRPATSSRAAVSIRTLVHSMVVSTPSVSKAMPAGVAPPAATAAV